MYGPTAGASDARRYMLYDANKKSVLVAYLLWFLLGVLGAHRFYLGRTSSAVAMLLISLVSFPLMLVAVGFVTWFAVIVWAVIDLFLIPGIVREFNERLAVDLAP